MQKTRKEEIKEKEAQLLHLHCPKCRKACVNFDYKCIFCGNSQVHSRTKKTEWKRNQKETGGVG